MDITKILEGFLSDTLILNGFIRPGRRICGRPNCRCSSGKLHPKRVEYGFYMNGKSYLRTIPEEVKDNVVAAIKRYKAIVKVLEKRFKRSQKDLFPKGFFRK